MKINKTLSAAVLTTVTAFSIPFAARLEALQHGDFITGD